MRLVPATPDHTREFQSAKSRFEIQISRCCRGGLSTFGCYWFKPGFSLQNQMKAQSRFYLTENVFAVVL